MIDLFLILMLKYDLISMGFTLDTPDKSCPGLVAWETYYKNKLATWSF